MAVRGLVGVARGLPWLGAGTLRGLGRAGLGWLEAAGQWWGGTQARERVCAVWMTYGAGPAGRVGGRGPAGRAPSAHRS